MADKRKVRIDVCGSSQPHQLRVLHGRQRGPIIPLRRLAAEETQKRVPRPKGISQTPIWPRSDSGLKVKPDSGLKVKPVFGPKVWPEVASRQEEIDEK